MGSFVYAHHSETERWLWARSYFVKRRKTNVSVFVTVLHCLAYLNVKTVGEIVKYGGRYVLVEVMIGRKTRRCSDKRHILLCWIKPKNGFFAQGHIQLRTDFQSLPGSKLLIACGSMIENLRKCRCLVPQWVEKVDRAELTKPTVVRTISCTVVRLL